MGCSTVVSADQSVNERSRWPGERRSAVSTRGSLLAAPMVVPGRTRLTVDQQVEQAAAPAETGLSWHQRTVSMMRLDDCAGQRHPSTGVAQVYLRTTVLLSRTVAVRPAQPRTNDQAQECDCTSQSDGAGRRDETSTATQTASVGVIETQCVEARRTRGGLPCLPQRWTWERRRLLGDQQPDGDVDRRQQRLPPRPGDRRQRGAPRR